MRLRSPPVPARPCFSGPVLTSSKRLAVPPFPGCQSSSSAAPPQREALASKSWEMGRQRRVDQRRHRQVIVPDDRDVLRDPEPALFQGRDRPDGQCVRRHDQRRRSLFFFQRKDIPPTAPSAGKAAVKPQQELFLCRNRGLHGGPPDTPSYRFWMMVEQSDPLRGRRWKQTRFSGGQTGCTPAPPDIRRDNRRFQPTASEDPDKTGRSKPLDSGTG